MTLPPSLPYRPDIQGLRAIAIMLVVFAHAEISAVSGGFIGVDLFFVLSGYLITGLLVREYEGDGTVHLARFLARRLKRLLPALLAMLALVLLIAPLLLSSHEAVEQSASVAYAATWTSNLFFAFSHFDYFSELRTRDLFLHTWSLGVEEQFYVLWSVVLLLALKLLSRQPRRGGHQKQLLLILGLLFASSLGLSWHWTMTHPAWSFYLMPSRIWQFAMGAGVFVWLHGRNTAGMPAPRLSRGWANGCASIGLALIFGSAVSLHPDMTYPGFWALLPSFGAVLVIAAGHGGTPQGASRVLAHPALIWFGDRSYSWYLWHWPVLMLGFALGTQKRPAETVWLVALSLLLAMLSYRWIEQPFRMGRLRPTGPARTILVSILAMLIVIAGARNYLDFFLPVPNNDPQRPVSLADAARRDMPIVYARGCDRSYSDKNVHPCLFGDTDAPRTVVLLGDSIGAQWFSLLPEIFRTPEWRTVVLTKSACPMVDEDYFYRPIGKTYTVCREWRDAVFAYLKSLRPNVVFLGSSATYGFTEAQWTDGSTRVLARLTAVAEHVVVVTGTPRLSFDGPGCLARHAPAADGPVAVNKSICREALVATQAADVANYLARAVKRFPTAGLLDLNDLVCPDGYCSAQNPAGLVVFRDSLHLTDSFVRTQVPKVIDRLKLIGLEPLLAK